MTNYVQLITSSPDEDAALEINSDICTLTKSEKLYLKLKKVESP